MGKDRKIDAYLLFVCFLFRAKQHPESGSSFSWEKFYQQIFYFETNGNSERKDLDMFGLELV